MLKHLQFEQMRIYKMHLWYHWQILAVQGMDSQIYHRCTISKGEGADLGNNLYTITFPKPANSMMGVTFDGAPQRHKVTSPV